MAKWSVELDDEFFDKVKYWDSGRQIELFAVQRILEAEGLSDTFALDLEGVPGWDALGQPMSLMLVAPIPHRYRVLHLEVHPGRRIVILDLD